MKILGIDPGLASVGWGLIESERGAFRLGGFGVLRTSKGTPLPERLAILAKSLRTLLEETKPHMVALEQLFFFKNKKTALTVAQARGVLMLCAEEYGAEIKELQPLVIKRSLSSFGLAQKAQVQRVVQKILNMPEPPFPDDAADALAIAITASLKASRYSELST